MKTYTNYNDRYPEPGVRAKLSAMKAEAPALKDMRLVPRHLFPAGTDPDGRLYSLEADRNSKLLEEGGNDDTPRRPVYDDEGKMQFVPTGNLDAAESEQIDYPRKTGTYAEISAEAIRLNGGQKLSGFVDWIFCPEPIEPQGAR